MQEGRNAERVAANFTGDPSVHIPAVHWEATTSQVLTLERIRGVKVNDSGALDATGLDCSALARSAATITLRMVFEHAFFHADPHPGTSSSRPMALSASSTSAWSALLTALLAGFATGDGNTMVDNVLALGVAAHVDSLRRIRHVRVSAGGSELLGRADGTPSARPVVPARQDVQETRAGMTHAA